MRIALALLFAYLLGSFLPAEYLARAKGIDIRGVGTHNPGATNALQELGLLPGLLTGAYDASVGLAAMWAASALGLAEVWVYAAGLTAIVGHVFPVFSRFHGGQGMAAATGMLLYSIGNAITRGWLTPGGLIVLAIVGLGVFAFTRSATMVGVIAVPALMIEFVAGGPDLAFGVFVGALTVLIWVTQMRLALDERLVTLGPGIRVHLARLHSRAH